MDKQTLLLLSITGCGRTYELQGCVEKSLDSCNVQFNPEKQNICLPVCACLSVCSVHLCSCRSFTGTYSVLNTFLVEVCV